MQKNNAKPKEVMVDGEECKNYNRIQTASRGWGWGQYSKDGVEMGTMLVGMGRGWG